MKKVLAIALTAVLLAGLIGGGIVMADGMKASKATAITGNITWIDANDDWEIILDQPIKPPGGKALFVDVAMVCGLFTQTEVTAQSQDPEWSRGEAKAYIMARVSAVDEDGNIFYATPSKGLPGGALETDGVMMAMREQSMWAKLYTDNPADNMTIGLALDTMDAHAMNFIIPELDSGEYVVVVEAKTFSDPELRGNKKDPGETGALAGIGFASATIEQVRLAKNTNIIELTDPN